MVDIEFVSEPQEEDEAVCVHLRFGERRVCCRFSEAAVRLYPPTGNDDDLLGQFGRHRGRFRALTGRKAAIV